MLRVSNDVMCIGPVVICIAVFLLTMFWEPARAGDIGCTAWFTMGLIVLFFVVVVALNSCH
jgi:hypothetical protein